MSSPPVSTSPCSPSSTAPGSSLELGSGGTSTGVPPAAATLSGYDLRQEGDRHVRPVAPAAAAPVGGEPDQRPARHRPRLSPDEDLVERLAAQVGNGRVRRRVADGDQAERPLVRRPAERLAQEPHRRRRVRQRGEAGRVQRLRAGSRPRSRPTPSRSSACRPSGSRRACSKTATSQGASVRCSLTKSVPSGARASSHSGLARRS